MHQDLNTRHDWPDKKAIVNLPIRFEENLKRISGNSLRLLGAQNKDIGAASKTLLQTGVKLCLRRKLRKWRPHLTLQGSRPLQFLEKILVYSRDIPHGIVL